VRFEGLAPPTREELQRMVERIARKTLALVRSRGLFDDEPRDALALAQADSVQQALPVAMEVPRHRSPRRRKRGRSSRSWDRWHRTAPGARSAVAAPGRRSDPASPEAGIDPCWPD
jgi:hypothetical protein